MLSFDMKTVVVIYTLINYIGTYTIALTWHRSKKHFRGVEFFLAYFAFLSVGLTLALGRGALPPFLSVVVANFFMFTGVAMFAFGMAKFLDVRISSRLYVLYCAEFTLLYSYFALLSPDIRMRMVIFPSMVLPMFAHVVDLVFRRADADHRRYASGVGATFVLFVILYLFRAYYAYSGPSVSSYFDTPMMDSYVNVITLLLGVNLMYSIQLMVNSKLFHNAEKDVVRQNALLKEMKMLAIRDHLTGAYNRRKIEEIVDDEIERFRRYRQPFSVILCDIDCFKKINDDYGHDVGDKSIVKVTEILSANIRAADKLGRWGGEEFLIVAPGLDIQQAVQAADRLRALVAGCKPDFFGCGESLTVSFGVAECAGEKDFKTVIKRADQALYRAKNGGRNRVEFWGP